MSLKRPAELPSAANTVQKRSKVANGYPQINTAEAAALRRSSFGSLSPGSPKSGSKASEVAADFKESLQDLQGNDRFQITNFTYIAKECTEHAMAIARVLEAHIRTTSPTRKLPALYVLDSIVKNVGTPYTIYFGQNLFKTFMDAYTLVDSQTRKNMEAMLKTWKEPIPGSTEARPVFPVEIVRPIENALIKVRTLFVQQAQLARAQRPMHALPPRPPVVSAAPTTSQQWSGVPTPLQNTSQYAPPPMQHQTEQKYVPPPTPSSQLASLFPGLIFQQPTPNSAVPIPPPFQYQQPPAHHQSTPQQQTSFLPLPNPTSAPGDYQNSYNLGALLQAAGTHLSQLLPQAQQTQQPFYAQQQMRSHTSVPSQPSPPTNLYAGLESLLKYTSTPEVSTPSLFPPPLPQHSFPQPSLNTPIPSLAPLTALTPATIQPVIPPPFSSTSTQVQTKDNIKDIDLTPSSLKIPHPHLIARLLYTSTPSQCLTCGRRFALTPEARARKARHLDAHFRTNRSIAEAARRGVSRSWFANELEWIQSREIDDAEEAPTVAANTTDELSTDFADDMAHTSLGGAASSKKEVYVKAPADAAINRHACPICQEEFATVWHDGAQEWVWMGAVMTGGRPYHKSCVEELTKDTGAAAGGAQGKVERALKRE